jgi:CRP-like cAMP-binding protein
MPERLFQPGDIIFQPGDAAREAYLLLSGTVEVLALSGDRFFCVARCGPGDVFGEMSLIEQGVRFLTARASSPCRTTILSRSEFLQFLTSSPERCQHYLQSLFSRLRKLSIVLDGADDTKSQRRLVYSVAIRPLTLRAEQSIAEKVLSVGRYPFRIGRVTEGTNAQAADGNDLSIQDTQPFQVSRAHAAIEATADGSVVVVDRGSHLGTIVNNQRLGALSSTCQAKLLPGDNRLVLGSRNSPFQFCITVE